MSRSISIEGPGVLSGKVRISGSKNASLPIIAATLLTDRPVHISNLPNITDVELLLNSLKKIGVNINGNLSHKHDNNFIFDCSNINTFKIPKDLSTTRSSILLAAPLLNKFGEVCIPIPTGCLIGERPINLHLDALEQMGASSSFQEDSITIKMQNKKFKGINIKLPIKSVGATETIIMAATLAEGVTNLKNAASEPEVQALIRFLNEAGANIHGNGTDNLTIKGVGKLNSLYENSYQIPTDRIEAASYAICAAATNGELLLQHTTLDLFSPVINIFNKIGIELIDKKENGILVPKSKTIKPVDIVTGPYPGFPTDLQPLMMPLLLLSKGVSTIRETLFESRFSHAFELIKMGANIKIENNLAILNGPVKFKGETVIATDLRAAKSLIVAAILAEGKTTIKNIHFLDRGYEDIKHKMSRCGIQITENEKE